MSASPKLQPGDLTKEELRTIVERVLDIMYPDGDPDPEQSTNELPEIAAILYDYHLLP